MGRYRKWLERSVSFAHHVEKLPGETRVRVDVGAPAAIADVAAVEKRLRIKLPPDLAEFFTDASASAKVWFRWEPEPGDALARLESLVDVPVIGGGRIAPLEALERMKESCLTWANETWVAGSPRDKAFWSKTLPFIGMANGDFIGIGRRGVIIYLSHDGESRQIAPRFDAFLDAWEKVCYIGPEIWFLEPFLDAAGDTLDPDSEPSQQLRAAFG